MGTINLDELSTHWDLDSAAMGHICGGFFLGMPMLAMSGPTQIAVSDAAQASNIGFGLGGGSSKNYSFSSPASLFGTMQTTSVNMQKSVVTVMGSHYQYLRG